MLPMDSQELLVAMFSGMKTHLKIIIQFSLDVKFF